MTGFNGTTSEIILAMEKGSRARAEARRQVRSPLTPSR